MAEAFNRIEWDVPPYFDVTGTVVLALIQAPPDERRRRPKGRTQVDVEIHGHDPLQRVDFSLATTSSLLASLDELRSDAERLAPDEWRLEYLHSPDYPGLFLDGFEFHDSGLTRVLFDFGDLDLLILDLHPDGSRTATVEP